MMHVFFSFLFFFFFFSSFLFKFFNWKHQLTIISLIIFMHYYNWAETMPNCYVLSDFTWQNVHDKHSVIQVQGHTAIVVPPGRPPSPPTSLSVFVLCSFFKCRYASFLSFFLSFFLLLFFSFFLLPFLLLVSLKKKRKKKVIWFAF